MAPDLDCLEACDLWIMEGCKVKGKDLKKSRRVSFCNKVLYKPIPAEGNQKMAANHRRTSRTMASQALRFGQPGPEDAIRRWADLEVEHEGNSSKILSGRHVYSIDSVVPSYSGKYKPSEEEGVDYIIGSCNNSDEAVQPVFGAKSTCIISEVSSNNNNRSALTPHDAVRSHEVSVAAASSREARKRDGHSVYAGEGQFEPIYHYVFCKRGRGRY